MKRDKERNILLTPLVVMTASIIILSILSQYFVNASLKGVRANVKTIDVVNKERMLSQDIVKAIATDNLLGQLEEVVSLDSLMNVFGHLHRTILTGSQQLNLQPLNSQFTPQYRMLDKAFTDFSDAVELNMDDENDNNALFVKLLTTQNGYLAQLNNLANAIINYSDNKIKTFQLVQVLAVGGSIMIVALEFAFILLPAINRIKKQNANLKQIAFNQSHLVRHPLTNIKELLYLISTSENNEERSELLLMAQKEADELDNIISNTVYNTTEYEQL